MLMFYWINFAAKLSSCVGHKSADLENDVRHSFPLKPETKTLL